MGDKWLRTTLALLVTRVISPFSVTCAYEFCIDFWDVRINLNLKVQRQGGWGLVFTLCNTALYITFHWNVLVYKPSDQGKTKENMEWRIILFFLVGLPLSFSYGTKNDKKYMCYSLNVVLSLLFDIIKQW